jgi:hypothetical protein
VIESIIETEKRCLLSDSEITPRKILRSWDKVWWPAAIENNIPPNEIKNKSLKASRIFTDYCKYDISGYMFPTVGTHITNQVGVGNSTLHSGVDIIKVNMNYTYRNINLVDFSMREMTEREIAIDTYIAAKAYSFYSHKEETVTYTHIKPLKDKLFMSSAIFRPDQMIQIEKMIKHVVSGIESNIRYMNRWNCKECKLCRNFKF